MEVPVKNSQGEVVDTLELDDRLFGVPMNQSLVHQAMVMYQANRRQGTHSTKTKAEVSGGGRKPWPQKHTGRARQGSIRSPQWRHGGVVFGPHPRSHRRDMPKKMRHAALKCMLSDKVRSDKLVLVDNITVDFRTKSMVDLLASLGVGPSTLIVTEAPEKAMVRSSRNISKVWTLPVNQLNAEQLLKRDTLVMTVEAARKAEEMWAFDAIRRPKKGVPVQESTGELELTEAGMVTEADVVTEANETNETTEANEDEAEGGEE